MYKIGIIGQGYVGTAVREIMSNYYEIQTFDIDEKKSDTGSISELVTNNDIIFVFFLYHSDSLIVKKYILKLLCYIGIFQY